ncbi:dGTP triphosphohydrolase [Thalassobaculum litoreum]|uniref:dGTPase n=1 Tax=Thalassobaculum litoreum DSM 18839 TaxID=1123362 RepID=A0A8G2BH11_9PROT|nr:dNTP triphosphohydrolase [Thalassobaculum litoreum]SDF37992.1 dGTPase [Thalassobaculum litoreum DSM 18839]
MKESIWSEDRRPRSGVDKNESDPSDIKELGVRSVLQQDYDRLLFSTPVRRLADKTQVWPMDENDGVRTRLTHSHEVANLARSIGTRVFHRVPDMFEGINLEETIQPILLSIGLGHDLGNPPFGHQGEAAIGRWFDDRKDWIFSHLSAAQASDGIDCPISEETRSEFLKFDGNPQSLRLLTKLQTHVEYMGLDLSAATLAASLKYPVAVSGVDKNNSLSKKFGYFESEKNIVEWIRSCTGLKEGQRHYLTWIMEACDDIAYSVLDVDDILKKSMLSPDDVLIELRRAVPDTEVVKKIEKRFLGVESGGRNPIIQRDIKIQYLRASLIESLISEASNNFVKESGLIRQFQLKSALLDGSDLCDALKDVARQYAFGHCAVLRAEAIGARAITDLMSAFWDAITSRSDHTKLDSRRSTAKAAYVYALISPNYIEEALNAAKSSGVAASMRYRELRLLTDMISGMTDSFAMKVWKDVSEIHDVDSS